MNDFRRNVHGILLNLSRENLVRATIAQTNECNPIFGAVLETDDVCGNRFRSFAVVGRAIRFGFGFVVLIDENARAATIAIDRNALATALPSSAIYFGNQLFCYVVRQIDGNGD